MTQVSRTRYSRHRVARGPCLSYSHSASPAKIRIPIATRADWPAPVRIHQSRSSQRTASSPAHERDDLHLVAFLQRKVVFVGAGQTPIQLDGDLFGFEVVRFD